MAAFYRAQVAPLAQAVAREENRAEAADLLRSLLDRIKLTPNDQGRLEIDLAGILTLAANRDRPLEASDPYVQQVKVVAGAGFEPATFRL
jgi:site-specific DNA recombinase